MTSNFVDTAPGGEHQTQYEEAATEIQPHKKSTGQLGSTQDQTTTDPSNTQERVEEQAEKADKKMENIRYGQTISEGGMGGMTNIQENEAKQEGYGR